MNYKPAMSSTILGKPVTVQYLGSTMNANMKVSEQCEIAASNDNQVPGTIKNIITYECERLVVTPLRS